MNYIWEALLMAKGQGLAPVTFLPAQRYSPYMEVILEEWNQKELGGDGKIEVNPYYRFYSIFKDYFPPDYKGNQEVREKLFHLILLYLGRLELELGKGKQDYYKEFILSEIQAGGYGRGRKEEFRFFSWEESLAVAEGILQLYRIGGSVEVFSTVLEKVFQSCYIYEKEDGKELLIYLGVRKSQENRTKLEAISSWFLPFTVDLTVYWEEHFCILGTEPVSVMGEIALY